MVLEDQNTFRPDPKVFPFIVCYKIKQEGFDYHMYFTPYSASVRKSLPNLPLFEGHVTGTRHFFFGLIGKFNIRLKLLTRK